MNVRRVSIGNRLFDVHALGQRLDAAFDSLYGQVMLGHAQPQLDGEFRSAALEYFDGFIDSVHAPAAHDHYFYGFSPLWIYFRNIWRFDWAEDIWRMALEPAQEWERTHTGHQVDKGVPYYYWAITALLLGRIDSGYVLAHQAAEEDSRTSSGLKYPDTPAYALVSLNYDKDDQAFKSWVEEQATYLDAFITDYSSTHGRPFGLDDLRDKFLRNPPSHDAVFLFSYTIARLKEMSEVPADAKQNPFAGQVQINLLFDLSLIIDAAIKPKNPRGRTFISHAEYLLLQAGHTLTNPELRRINGHFNGNFGGTLTDALNGMLAINGSILDRLQNDVVVAYGLRNRRAHNIESEPAVWNDFDRVQKAIFRTLCAAIDYLY